jgi:hypothetical protein
MGFGAFHPRKSPVSRSERIFGRDAGYGLEIKSGAKSPHSNASREIPTSSV